MHLLAVSDPSPPEQVSLRCAAKCNSTHFPTDSTTSLPASLPLCCVEVISGAERTRAPAWPQSTQGLAVPPGTILSKPSGKSIAGLCSSPKPRKENRASCLSCLQPFLAGPGGNKRGSCPCRWKASWESSFDSQPLPEAIHPREH